MVALSLLLGVSAYAGDADDAQVRRLIVESSVATYHAQGQACACPYDTADDGSSCSGTSAYVGAAHGRLLCFRGDVTAAMIQAWHRSHR